MTVGELRVILAALDSEMEVRVNPCGNEELIPWYPDCQSFGAECKCPEIKDDEPICYMCGGLAYECNCLDGDIPF